MDDGATTGAMTEIALALAMAFFCILVLALVSMGNPHASDGPALSAERVETAGPGTPPRPLEDDERLILFHADRYLAPDGSAVDPASLAGERVVLAVDPNLPLARILAGRSAIPGSQVRITPLDSAWIDHLAAGGPQ